jgi:hypothetical protein
MVPYVAVPSAGSEPGARRPVLTCAELIAYTRQFDAYGQSVAPAIDHLPLVRVGLDPWYAALRGTPLVDRLVPAPQILHGEVVATYRVQLASVPDSLCSVGACTDAGLLDSVP